MRRARPVGQRVLVGLCVVVGLLGCDSAQETPGGGTTDGDRDAGSVPIGTGGAGAGGGGPGAGGAGPGSGGSDPNDGCEDDAEFFEDRLWPTVFAPRCLACHVEGGPATDTRMVLRPESAEGWRAHNLEQIAQVARAEEDGQPMLLLKPTGRRVHTGGVVVPPGSAEYDDLVRLTARLRDEVDRCGEGLPPDEVPDPPDARCTDLGALQPGRRLLRRLTHTEYQNTVADLTGVAIDAHASFVADPLRHGFENEPDLLEVSGLLATQYNQIAEAIAEQMDIGSQLPCEIAEGDLACAHRFIAAFGRRAFRRPLTADEITAYRDLFSLVMSQECFEQGARWVVAGMLQSPHFLYRTELGRADAGAFVLTPYEIASGLSYLLWQSMPDDALLDAAAEGDLLDPEVRAAHVARMMEDPRMLGTLGDFIGRWLGTRDLLSVVRDSEIYAALYFELRASMETETRRFAEDIWSDGRSFRELFTADHTWLDAPLAEYYGIPLEGAPEPDGFQRVALDGARGGGILAHGSMMTTHASPRSSSPILRGVMVREQLLCHELPPPPAGLDVQPPAFDPTLTTRERFAQHTDDPACAGCHQLIDPIGFGFEHYDGIGRYRADDEGFPVDASGAVVGVGEGLAFDGVGELGAILAEAPEVARCYSRQWMRFGMGESVGVDATCYVNALTATLESADGRMSAVVEALTRTPHFTRRIGEPGESDVPGAALVPAEPGTVVGVADPGVPPAGLATPACGVPVAGPVGPGPGSDGLEVSSREDRWQTGMCAYYTVQNVSADPVEWAVDVDVEGTINNGWNAMRTGDSGRVTFSGVDWNRVVDAEQQVEFGFCTQF